MEKEGGEGEGKGYAGPMSNCFLRACSSKWCSMGVQWAGAVKCITGYGNGLVVAVRVCSWHHQTAPVAGCDRHSLCCLTSWALGHNADFSSSPGLSLPFSQQQTDWPQQLRSYDLIALYKYVYCYWQTDYGSEATSAVANGGESVVSSDHSSGSRWRDWLACLPVWLDEHWVTTLVDRQTTAV